MNKLEPTYTVADFDYDLPQELIAQTPIDNREHAKMVVVDRQNHTIAHRRFDDIIKYLNEGDCLVLNNTKVIPARLYGYKESTGAKVEFLLIKPIGYENEWEVILRPGKKVRVGDVIVFGEGKLRAQILKRYENGNRLVKFLFDGIFYNVLDEIGEMPLPPYITTKLARENSARYQTTYAQVEGSCAAPTAGLHFTSDVLDALKGKGVRICFVTLHVGIGTFRPVSVENIAEHEMHAEWYELSEETANIINETKKQKKRVIAVGTTSTRTLESCALEDGTVRSGSGETSIFIYPPYQYKVVDGLVTNFHLPKSTLLMLVSALYSRDAIINVYKEAIAQSYRFFSFGDAMLIL